MAAMLLALRQQKADLSKAREATTASVKSQLATLIARSTTEAMEKDKPIEELLTFFHTIGFDAIDQNKLNRVIAAINLNPRLYGLQQPMDFAG